MPSKRFHDDFLVRIKTGTRPISVLWGSPGRGKSTYLSYLVQSLREADLPAVRHHYFLALDDSTVDRVSFTEISYSLMDQISGRYPDAVRGLERSDDQLRKWLAECGRHFAAQGTGLFGLCAGKLPKNMLRYFHRPSARQRHAYFSIGCDPDNLRPKF